MSNTYTTEFQSVSNGETTTINPQDLITQSGVISVKNAEVQWRGDSDIQQTTDSGSNYNRDSGRARVKTVKDDKVNTDSATTTGTTNTVTEPFSITNSESGSFRSATTSVFAEKPDLPQGADVKSVTIRYYLVEDSGGDEYGIKVEYDDDPYDAANYDETQSGLSVDGNSTKKIFEDTVSAGSNSYSQMDGAQIRLIDGGSSFGTVGIKAEIEVNGVKESVEQRVERETASTTFPNISGVTSHKLEVFEDGNKVEEQTYPSGNKVGETVSRVSPNNEGSTVTIRCISYGETREVVPATLTVEYPDIPAGYNFDNHDIHRDGYGDSFDIVYDNKIGETVTETVSDPNKGEVELELETEYSRTVTTSDDTVNPTIEGTYLDSGIDTSRVLFVMDKSSSVDQPKQIDVALNILSSLPDSTVSSLLSFNFDASIDAPIATLGDNREILKQAIQSLPSEGGTDIENAIDFARETLGDSETEGGTIVLISDGNTYTEITEISKYVDDITFDFISVGIGDDINSEFLIQLSSLLDGTYFENSVEDTVISTRLNDNELSSWKELSGFTSNEQELTHSIQESGKAEFRIRFDWVFKTPEPIYGVTGFYDESENVWRECVVADVNSNSLEYNHINVYNNDVGGWGALDVVDLSDDSAIEAFQFYDDDEGWLAPREYETV